MYSPINEMQTPTFETTAAAAAATTPTTDGLGNNLELSSGMDYMRRFSYADLLSNHSESSLSDYEQQTPSPSNDYEDYIFHQQQQQQQFQLHHPLDEQKRRMSMIEQATSYYQQQQRSSYMLPTDYLHSTNNTTNSMLSPSTLGYSPAVTAVSNQYSHHQYAQQRSMSYSAGDVMSTLVPSIFEYNPTCPSSPMTLDTTSMVNFNESNTSGSMISRDRLDSLSSLSSDSMASPPHQQQQQQTKLTKSGKVKQCRSRGRRVSSNPTIGAKMFTCKHDDCGKIFKRSEHLKRHIRSIHTLEKPFECPYQSCSKRFSRSDNLNQHIRIHRHTTKEKASSNNGSSTSSSSSSTSPASSVSSSVSSRHSSSFSNCMPSYV
ncbi:uncharacterized protein BX664DRAFT_277899 [Halteromyces radiatus]|uniref:uncharacterized protein n=1 Tax=Halteromyces radiatus TaxID=101107 RepID=UPI00221E962C|nr:uncharacterized protein BX664DRAFT_277899 [Halteromyces radiatus]KAI8093138.1 hypothetical protein BX664DRAFT_277899 [Halteromyces radiatus]